MITKVVASMQREITLSAPYIDLGDNQFLSHHTHEIMLSGLVVGHIMLTFYDYGKAHDSFTSWRWIADDSSYLSAMRDYLFDTSVSVATLPKVMIEGLSGPARVMIIDEVLVISGFEGKGIIGQALDSITELHEANCSFSILTGWTDLARKCQRIGQMPDAIFNELGFHPVDDEIMARQSVGQTSSKVVGS